MKVLNQNVHSLKSKVQRINQELGAQVKDGLGDMGQPALRWLGVRNSIRNVVHAMTNDTVSPNLAIDEGKWEWDPFRPVV